MGKRGNAAQITDSDVLEIGENGTGRKVNPNVKGVRASLSNEVFAALESKEDESGIERSLIIESALRVFLNADKETRVQALKDTRASRIVAENDNI